MDDRADAVSIGARLRTIRTSRKLSLTHIEEVSGGQFKASVLGAYERAERMISATRLMDLARFYGVDPAMLLPTVSNPDELRRAVLDARVTLAIQLQPELRGTVSAEALKLVAEADETLAEALRYLDPDPDGSTAPTRFLVVGTAS